MVASAAWAASGNAAKAIASSEIAHKFLDDDIMLTKPRRFL